MQGSTSSVQTSAPVEAEKRSNPLRSVMLFGLAALIGFGAILIANLVLRGSYAFMGSEIKPPKAAADFELQAHDGSMFRLSDQRGKVVLAFFGYTNCPDVCPTTLAEFKQVRELLGSRADEVVFTFITIDPERDTAERLAEYVPLFSEAILGLTGSEAELTPVWADFGVYRQRQDVGSAAGYLMDHSTRAYAIDKQGQVRVTFFFGQSPEAIVQDVIYLLGE